MKRFKDLIEELNQLTEKLSASDPIEKWIKDFIDSDDPKFDGKTKEERIDMAKGAYYAAQKKNESVVTEAPAQEKLAKDIEKQAKKVSSSTDKATYMKVAELVRKNQMSKAERVAKTLKGDARDELLFALSIEESKDEYTDSLKQRIEKIKKSSLSPEAKRAAITTLMHRSKAAR